MEENKGKKIVLRKIHLESFIEVLQELYENGVDYVDLHGTNDEEQDSIDISFKREYTVFKDTSGKEEHEEEEENENEDISPKIITKLSDDNLNQLL